ncbi:Rossmann-fold NAD(P)-binding domain-containing protein [Sutcliffiella halmapala]|uniref:hypothetical protein n=1 Tax=Sutcliffiella halmapala TaxID=79882 RepID=UPI000995361D|nr:hypothetical protein [Sutcliffiella halmapala]
MRNVMVVGATNFIGFALCKQLIKKEVQVVGIAFTKSPNDQAEEKLMEIGRNAFFHFQEKQEPDDEFLETEFDVAYFCLEKEDVFVREEISSFQGIANKAKKVFFVLPVKSDVSRTKLQEIIKTENVHLVMYPSVFGPWQPDSEPIQQRIIEEISEEPLNDKLEVLQDNILYVDDLAEALLTLGERPNIGHSISLVNKEKKALEAIAKELNFTIIEKSNLDLKEDKQEEIEEVFYINSTISILEALSNQRKNTAKRLKLNL